MISIQHLNKRFGTVQAVDDLSLEIPAGELFCFLGPNGTNLGRRNLTEHLFVSRPISLSVAAPSLQL